MSKKPKGKPRGRNGGRPKGPPTTRLQIRILVTDLEHINRNRGTMPLAQYIMQHPGFDAK